MIVNKTHDGKAVREGFSRDFFLPPERCLGGCKYGERIRALSLADAISFANSHLPRNTSTEWIKLIRTPSASIFLVKFPESALAVFADGVNSVEIRRARVSHIINSVEDIKTSSHELDGFRLLRARNSRYFNSIRFDCTDRNALILSLAQYGHVKAIDIIEKDFCHVAQIPQLVKYL